MTPGSLKDSISHRAGNSSHKDGRKLGRLLHEPIDHGRAGELYAALSKCRKANFVLMLGSTRLSDLPGFSAAGAGPEAIRDTPAIDARALLGLLKPGECLPVSPSGVTSPVVLTRAALSFINHNKLIVDCGTFNRADAGEIILAGGPAASPEEGEALSAETVENLYAAGKNQAGQLHDQELVVLAECVPGGTTTALGVLTALGYDAHKLVSGSHQRPDHNLKRDLISRGLRAAAKKHDRTEAQLTELIGDEPLKAVSMVGDGMQAFACGFLSERDNRGGLTVLAGGSQMLAVYALARAVAANGSPSLNSTIVATTKWVADDTGADTKALAELVGAPFAASYPDFSKSAHAGLRAYEEGNVKEGVGAGAAMLLAHLMGQADEETLMTVIDSYYEALIG